MFFNLKTQTDEISAEKMPPLFCRSSFLYDLVKADASVRAAETAGSSGSCFRQCDRCDGLHMNRLTHRELESHPKEPKRLCRHRSMKVHVVFKVVLLISHKSLQSSLSLVRLYETYLPPAAEGEDAKTEKKASQQIAAEAKHNFKHGLGETVVVVGGSVI